MYKALLMLFLLGCEPQEVRTKLSIEKGARTAPVTKKVSIEKRATAASVTKKVGAGHALIDRHCGRCHNAKKTKGGLDLRSMLPEAGGLLKNTAVWRRSLSYLKSHEMPPADSKEITSADREQMQQWLDKGLEQAYASGEDSPGPSLIRRLSRREYNNTIQDLLYIKFSASKNFPADNSGYGFDNIAGLLSVPPLMLEKYLLTARRAVDIAINGDPSKKSLIKLSPASFKCVGVGRAVGTAHSLLTKAQLSTSFNLEQAGEYEITVEAAGDQAGEEPVKMTVAMNSSSAKLFLVKNKRNQPKSFRLKEQLKSGRQTLQLAFTNDYYNKALRADRNLHVYKVVVKGPLKSAALSESHRKLVGVKNDVEVAIKTFLRRAFRRPLKSDEEKPYLKLFHKMKGTGKTYEQSLKTVFTAALVSPHFLFRMEEKALSGVSRVRGVDVAVRLSYFLNSSMPDTALMTLASNNKLSEESDIKKHFYKMVAAPEVRRFCEDFAGQWLQVRSVDEVDPDLKFFPEWSNTLKSSMKQEAYHYFQDMLQRNRPLREFIRTDRLFVNRTLAAHYGLEGNYTKAFRTVKANKQRNSIFTTAAVLTLTSMPSRTSPVKRGQWLMEEILGSAPPPPPADAPSLEEAADHKNLDMRQRLEKHREQDKCAVCHRQMDPLGFSLENYDALGKWRTKENGKTIVVGGVLSDKTELQSVSDLQDYLLQHEEEFAFTFLSKLMIYALGRQLNEKDNKTLYGILTKTRADGFRLQDLVREVVLSKQFLYT